MLRSFETWRSSRAIAFATAIVVGAIVGESCIGTVQAQTLGLSALTTFGSNGWLAPGSIAYLGTGNNERGLAYNPSTKNLVLVSRASVSGTGNNIVILNGTTGSVVKLMNADGISGGTFAINMAGVSGDGKICVGNLATGGGAFKVYSWDGESSLVPPTVPFTWTVPTNSTTSSGTGAYRFGDSFDVYGSGTSVQFAAAGNTTGTTGGLGTGFRNNGNFLVGTTNTTNTFTLFKGMANTGTATNNYRSSLSFVDADTVIGMEGGAAKVTDFIFSSGTQQGANATVISSIQSGAAPLGGTAQYKIIDYVAMGSKSYLAALRAGDSATGNGANIVDVYDVTSTITQLSGTNPLLVASLSVTTGTVANGNNTGQIAWGEVTYEPNNQIYSAPLYALNTNNGVQAMVFAVPEPSTTLAAGVCTVGLAAMMLRGRRRGQDA
ncbi:MAG: hypothetical protein KGR24_02830 [Planctomycetes bacterium]|nr:hypothetical protein [Planctomycetota bacterium]